MQQMPLIWFVYISQQMKITQRSWRMEIRSLHSWTNTCWKHIVELIILILWPYPHIFPGQREGCENVTTIPWRDIVNASAMGDEIYVQTSRLPYVMQGRVKSPFILQSPDNLPDAHCHDFALHILKGENGLIPEVERFRWEDTSTRWDLLTSQVQLIDSM